MERVPGGDVYWVESRQRYVGAVEMPRQDGKRGRRTVSDKNKTKARAKLSKLKAQRDRVGVVGPQNITVEKILRDLIDYPPDTWRTFATKSVRGSDAETIIRVIGTKRLAQLTVHDVEAMLGKMAADGKSAGHMKMIRTLLCMAIDRAMRDDLVGRNVARMAKVPFGRTRTSRSMTAEQAQKLLALDLTPWWRAYIAVACSTGMRPGELMGLTWDVIDLDTRVLRVVASAKRVAWDAAAEGPQTGRRGAQRARREDAAAPSTIKLAGLKNEHSRRAIELSPGTAALLRAHREDQSARQLELFGAKPDGPAFVFPDDEGRLMWPDTVRMGFHRLCDQAGIGRWQLRESRHTLVSMLSHDGVPLEQIADFVGHKNSRVTSTVYRHQLADVVAAPPGVMDRILGLSE